MRERTLAEAGLRPRRPFGSRDIIHAIFRGGQSRDERLALAFILLTRLVSPAE